MKLARKIVKNGMRVTLLPLVLFICACCFCFYTIFILLGGTDVNSPADFTSAQDLLENYDSNSVTGQAGEPILPLTPQLTILEQSDILSTPLDRAGKLYFFDQICNRVSEEDRPAFCSG